jgi:hypothetical protein
MSGSVPAITAISTGDHRSLLAQSSSGPWDYCALCSKISVVVWRVVVPIKGTGTTTAHDDNPVVPDHSGRLETTQTTARKIARKRKFRVHLGAPSFRRKDAPHLRHKSCAPRFALSVGHILRRPTCPAFRDKNRDPRRHTRGVKHASKNGVTLHLLDTAMKCRGKPAK